MASALIPPWYHHQRTSKNGLLIAAFFFGASIAVAAFDSAKAGRQSFRLWRRCHKIKAYIVMLWVVIFMCTIGSICAWLFLVGKIPPSIWFFVPILFAWAIEIQCLMQILANRLSLILYNPDKERRLKVGLFIAIGLINVSVFCIWVPARLQVSETFVHLNNIWDRIEKALFAIIDLSLNAYFMWLVKDKLVANGLTQYNTVYRCNLAMVTLSVSLDILIIGLMSLPDTAVYAQVHPLAFLVKLNIEMSMAELLAKVVKRRSSETEPSLPTSNSYHPYLCMESFDREWLGSARNLIMPTSDGQMQDFNLGLFDDKKGPFSGVLEDVPSEQALPKTFTRAGRSRIGSVYHIEHSDRGNNALRV